MATYGHFSPDGTEYVITRPDTPRPWYNRFGNTSYGVVLSHTGGGYSIHGDTYRHQLTYYVPRFDQSGRYLYIRDNEAKNYWSVGWAPVRAKLDTWECRHGLGWTTWVACRQRLRAELTIFVPLAGAVELWEFVLINTGRRLLSATAFPFVEWSIDDGNGQGVDDLVYAASTDAEYDPASRSIVASRRHAGKFCFHRAFMAVDRDPDGWDANRAAFVGNGRTLADPIAVERGACSGTPSYAEVSVGAFAFQSVLRPGMSWRLHVLIGMANSRRERKALIRRFLRPGSVARERAAVRASWDDLTQRFHIETPDPAFDLYVNRWLTKHVKVNGGTPAVRSLNIGFRNYIQDALGTVFLDPSRARFLITDALRYQRAGGDACPWFSKSGQPPRPPRHVDIKMWPILAVAAYLRETGDWSLLRERVPFWDDPHTSSVLEHLDRAIDKCWQERGRHSLSLIGLGDWNDNLNGMGRNGKGESVWMSEAVLWALRDLAAIHDRVGHRARAAKLLSRADTLKKAINRHGWDGRWYLMGYTDSGRRVGTRYAKQGRIFLLPQVWAILSGAAEGKRLAKIFRVIDRRLETPYGPMLMDRPFRKADIGIGALSFLAQGMSENGSIYSHGVAFKLCADGLAGRGRELYRGLLKLFPYTHDPDVTRNEPFVLPNLYRPAAVPRKYGATHRSWVTSTPNWVLKAVIEGLFGLRSTHRGLVISPSLPPEWHQCKIRRSIRGAIYDVTILNRSGQRPRTVQLLLNGTPLPGNTVPWQKSGRIHTITAILSA